jgi:type IV secretory pathway VirB9-like protein
MPASMPYGAMTAPMNAMGSMAYPPQTPAPSYGAAPPMQNPYGAPPASAPMMSGMGGGSQNMNYSFTGEQAITPTQLYDDGQNTYLSFSGSQMVPQVYAVGADRREQAVATNTQGQTVIVQGVYPQLVLRFGNSHACIFNENMQR